ncbi:hypothetical protein CORT_0C00100 [Candida orthopsilosis Co 90-125]|uniref:Uncharacterized protein n=1 Tax=Candida orthopsilosis (strain 90-125) TaxID=1136231 RepID=H8X3B6_CANO9|nr:hypothetical protein CORT_0C00100 [Candida orthopsilosis Co 90-125]CCG25389.1 hypothetical protein CORT_0C00100 [Candida orthopsilosis Co 90-125]
MVQIILYKPILVACAKFNCMRMYPSKANYHFSRSQKTMEIHVQESGNLPLTRDAYNRANRITIENCDIKPSQNGEQLKPLLHYAINTLYINWKKDTKNTTPT